MADVFTTDHLSKDLRRRAARGGAATIVSQALRFLLNVGSTAVLARLIAPDDHGLVGMVAVITGLLAMFKDLGLSAATIAAHDLTHRQASALFWTNAAAGLLVGAVTGAVAPAIAAFYGRNELTAIAWAYAAGFVLAGLAVQHLALLKRQMRFTSIAAIEVVATGLGLTSAIVLARDGFGYWALVNGQLVIASTTLMGAWLVCRWRPGWPGTFAGIRHMLAFGANFTGFHFVHYVSSHLDQVLIGRVWGAQVLGFYDKAYQLLLLPIQKINQPVNAVAMPALSRLTQSPERYRDGYRRILEKLSLLTMPAAAFLIGTSDWLVRVVLGPRWEPAGVLFAVLGFGAFVMPISHSTGWLFLSQNRTGEMFRWAVYDSTMKVVCVLAGLPWGPLGVAIGTVAKLYLQLPVLCWYVCRRGPVSVVDIYRAVAPSLYASLVALLAVTMFRVLIDVPSPVVGLAGAFVVTITTCLAVLAALSAGRGVLRDVTATVSALSPTRTAR